MKQLAPIHRILIAGICFISLLLIGAFFLFRKSIAAPSTPTPLVDPNQASISEIELAIRSMIDFEVQSLPAFFLYENRIENITISADGNWATAWLIPEDPDSGETIPTEPGLVIARRGDGGWQVFLPSDPGWLEALLKSPDELLSPERKQFWEQVFQVNIQAAPAAPIGGYRLPFPGGDTRRLTQSVGHDRYTPSGNAHYSFDFATAYPSTLFQVVAAKAGVVRRVRWTQSNGDATEPGNYIVLEDTSTNPTTYQLYLHLAQDSIPPELRILGTPVRRGQYLGMADDTGASSGHHLHFMVHTSSLSYWGTSVDITFEDVAINGGRPRIASDQAYCDSDDVCSQTQIDYRSLNFLNPDPNPPVGGLAEPPFGASVANSLLRMVGWAYDDSSGLYSAQFMVNYNDSWQTIGSTYNTNWFALNWDWCAAGVPDGPLSLALQIRDKAFNQTPGLPGLTHVMKNFSCAPPPPACIPSANQIALWSRKDFNDECVVLGTGSHNSAAALGDLGEENAASVQVGANVKATLFTNPSLQGRSETFSASDSNLSDNRINKNSVSSVLVQSRTATPAVPALIWPVAGATFVADSPISLSWNDSGGAAQFQARLRQGTTTLQSTLWQSEPTWHVTGLAPGSYTWQVKSRFGTIESAWSTARPLTVQSGVITPGPEAAAPLTDPMEEEGEWSHSGSWTLTTAANHSGSGQRSWKYAPAPGSYDTGAANAGFLTSAPISLPPGSTYYLRFWYQYETETGEPHWDQRWVQISVNGGPFVNVLQLADDPMNYWLQSPAISLADYAGQTIRVRFYFVTLDAQLNTFKGWFIDDFSLTETPPPACDDSDDLPALASALTSGAATGSICPGGDIDYFRFEAAAGERIGAWVEAQVNGSPLDSVLTLLDTDGHSVLEENDDIVMYERTDSAIAYRLQRTGTYYLKVQAWAHPSSGDLDHAYTLRLAKDAQDPTAAFIFPGPNGGIGAGSVTLRVQAADTGSGVSRVRFFWHPADWQAGHWTALGTDVDGSDGWGLTFDASRTPNLYNGALYAEVFDRAGNSINVGVWQLKLSVNNYLPMVLK